MKIKDDIVKWKEQIEALSFKICNLEAESKEFYQEIKDIKDKVTELARITNDMTEALLSLLRQQMGD